MRFFPVIALLALTACTDTATGTTAAALRGGAQQAYFAGYHERLFFAAAETCNEPGQTVVRPNRDEVRCESLPTPQAAAGLILEQNGTVEDLPRYVFAFRGAQSGSGYVVTADTHIRVPQRDGGVRRLRLRDPRLEAELREILMIAGGRPVQTK